MSHQLTDYPVIAAIKSAQAAQDCIATPITTVFILSSDILSLPGQVKLLKEGGKKVFIHLDLAEGIGKDNAGVQYVAQVLQPAGVISTRTALLKLASAQGLIGIQRMFLVDSSSFLSGINQIKVRKPDYVEVMPGLVPKAIAQLHRESSCPVIAGGMITTYEDAASALNAGAIAVSTSSQELWRAF